ncbi:MAG: SAM-dependent methyltransferase [Cyclobacteriaceae bacterium]|nr:MAG: SAM-dependent methyltransferase [Cyclobacteriaceae bacterium]
MADLWGKALLDYYLGVQQDPLILHTSFGEPEEVPMEVFFPGAGFSRQEMFALNLCKGPVLDIGAGTGRHAGMLQDSGHRVVALEKSPGACEVMRRSGISEVIEQDIYHYDGGGFQTGLMMMNGLGLAGSLDKLPDLLDQVISKLLPGGQILADSCDVHYLYLQEQLPETAYYGEQEYCYEYQGEKDTPFPWLFVDMDRLKYAAKKIGLSVQIVFLEGEQYLARISKPLP